MKRNFCFWPRVLLAFIVLLACPRFGLAATSAISSGENQTGTITSGSADAYTFTGTSGDNIILRVGTTNFAPRIDLYAPGGALMASAFVNNSGYRDAFLYLTLTNSGPFTAVVTGLFSGAGTYGLRLAYLPGSFVVPAGEAGGPLTNGAHYAGTMDLGGLGMWSFNANAGDNIQLRMGTVGFDPRIDLYGPNGTLVRSSFVNNSGYTDAALLLQLTNSGSYTVVVSSYLLNYSGTYTLTLAQSPEPFVTSTGDEGGALINGTLNAGTIEVGDLDMWSFNANAGDNIQLRMGTVGFDPRIDLYGPNGTLVASAFVNNSGFTDAALLLQLTNTGSYTVVVSSYLLNYSGTYTLTLAQIPEPFVISPGEQGGMLTNGTVNPGTMHVGGLDMWSFNANAGDSIQLRMGTVGFDPRIDLYGPNGTLVASSFVNNSGFTDDALSLQLTNTGTFTVVVSSYLLNDSGTYTLTLAQIPEPFVVSPGDSGGVLTNGILNAGTMHVGDLDMWTFMANAGDNVELRMGTVGFDPRIDLYGPNGTLVASSFVNNSGYTDDALSLQLTNTGTFTVVVSSYLLNYSGTYSLTLAHEPGNVFVSPGDEGGVMINGFSVQGTNSIGDLDVWSFYGTVGDSNLFRIGTAGFDPSLRLYGPNGALVGQAFSPNPGITTNFLTYIVTNAGNYTLVSSAYPLNQSGTYNLKQSRVPPDLILPATQTVNDEGATLNLPVSAQDPDDPTKSLTFLLVSAPPSMALTTLGPTNASLSWTTTDADGPSTNVIVVTVTDVVLSKPFTRTNSFTVVVLEVNKPPVLPIVPSQTVNELTTLTVTNAATEPDLHSTTIGYGLINPPTGANIDANGVFTWTPAQTQSPGTNTITTVVTNTNPFDLINPHLTATNSFTVVVKEVNQPPVLPTIPVQTVNELTLLTVTNAATEPNIHSTTTGYGLINPPPGVNISASGIITWTPTQNQSPATNTITIVVTNNNPFDLINPQLTATNSFTVVVKEVNKPPVLPIVPLQTVNELNLLTVTNAATEPNIHSTTTGYGLINPPPGVNISASGIITWTPTQNQSPTTNTITTVVTNNNPYDLINPQLTATNSFTVVVKEVNKPPVLPAIPVQTVSELTLITVTNTASEPNIHSTTTGYGLINPPAGVNISASGIITWTPTQNQSPATNTITTVVTNNNSFDLINPQLTATNTFTVIVKEVNMPPVLPTIPLQTVDELTLLTVTNTATEPNINATSTSYTLINAPLGVNVDANGIITWTPSRTQSASTNIITTVVTNTDLYDSVNPHLTATNSFTVIVKYVNSPPVLQSIADTSVHYGTLLSVQALASDPDIPAEALTFSLVVFPTNMTINATNGLITWIPALAQLGSNIVTLKVTDSGQPPLSATTTFHVLVLGQQPQLGAQLLPGHLVQLNILGDIGVTYEVQVSTNLTGWDNLAPVTPTSSPYPYIDPASSGITRRFYRLKLSQ